MKHPKAKKKKKSKNLSSRTGTLDDEEKKKTISQEVEVQPSAASMLPLRPVGTFLFVWDPLGKLHVSTICWGLELVASCLESD